MVRVIPLLVLFVLALSPTDAMAQRRRQRPPDGPPSKEAIHKRLLGMFDKNHDGKLDREERAEARKAIEELREKRGKRARDGGGRRPPDGKSGVTPRRRGGPPPPSADEMRPRARRRAALRGE